MGGKPFVPSACSLFKRPTNAKASAYVCARRLLWQRKYWGWGQVRSLCLALASHTSTITKILSTHTRINICTRMLRKAAALFCWLSARSATQTTKHSSAPPTRRAAACPLATRSCGGETRLRGAGCECKTQAVPQALLPHRFRRPHQPRRLHHPSAQHTQTPPAPQWSSKRIYIYVDTDIHNNTDRHTYIPIYNIYNAYIHTCMHACMHACMHTYIRAPSAARLAIYVYICVYM
jgi:hypothetical protein